MSEIVVGLDVSPSSQSALAWAASHARSTGAEIRAVHAVPVAAATVASADWMGMATSPMADDSVDRAYRDAVTAVWETVKPEPSWRLEFRKGDPGRLLVAESAHAELLVIGTREHVGWGRILTGSVSHYCLSHATCPIVAVPPVLTRAHEDQPQPLDDAAPPET